MGSKKLQIRMSDSGIEAIKKRAGLSGKNLSDFVRELIESGLENRSETSPAIDPETIKKMIETAIKSSPGSGSGIDPKLFRYQVETLAKIEFILGEVARDRPGGEGKIMNWMQDAKKKGKEILQDLQMDKTSSHQIAPKRIFSRVGEKSETEKSDFDFDSLPKI